MKMCKEWSDFIANEKAKPYYKSLQVFLDKEYQTKIIYPPKEDQFNAFLYTPFKNVKVVILGQDPYHNEKQAHGLSFSVQKDQKIPPSLRNIYKELYDDLGVEPAQHGDLIKWATQGVLLLNTILTVEENEPLSHKNKGWEVFTNNVIHFLNQDDSPKVFVLWGNNAIKKGEFITNKNHKVISSSHPSPLSARHSFFGSKVFRQINHFLRENNRKEIDFKLT